MVNHQDSEPNYIKVGAKWYHVDSREFETLCEDMYMRFEEECVNEDRINEYCDFVQDNNHDSDLPF